MGQSQSAKSNPATTCAAPPQPANNISPYQRTIEVAGVGASDKDKLIASPKLLGQLAANLPINCNGDKWYLLYNSKINGKSFNKLVQLLCGKGATIIIISTTAGNKILGGFNESEWLDVSARDKQAVSNSAAARRANREGQNTASLASRPANQNNLFFGTSGCFVFSAQKSGDNLNVFKANSSLNSNFMYLFDTHPDADKVGIGMGGQPGYFGWFLDRWLENGVCAGESCSTFRSPRLSDTEKWEVEAVEAYAVHPDMVKAFCESGLPGSSSSVLDPNANTTANKFLLEAHGIHKFDQNERTEC